MEHKASRRREDPEAREGLDHLDEDAEVHESLDRVEDVAGEFVVAVEAGLARALPPHLRARAWARRRPVTHVIWRAGVLLVGIVLVIAGIAMLVLPGPGWAAIILGLVVLASEYAWANRLLEPVRRWARAATDRVLRRRRGSDTATPDRH